MNLRRRQRIALKAGLLVAGVLLALGPAPARAAGCTIMLGGPPLAVTGALVGVLSETLESPPAQAAPGGTGPLAAGTYPVGLGVRLAQAAEIGTFVPLMVPGTGDCRGSLAGLPGAVEIHAQSRVDVMLDDSGSPVINPATGSPRLTSGPISGGFKIVTPTGVVRGKLDGTLDFGPTNLDLVGQRPQPLVLASGTWALQGRNVLSGGFAGLALVPVPPTLCPLGVWCYVDPTFALPGGVDTGMGVQLVPLSPSDFNQFGAPEAKFVVTFFTQQ